MKKVNQHLGTRLRELRGTQPMTEVEKHTGVTRGNLLRYEQGVYLPKTKALKALANYYDVSYQELRSLYYEDLYGQDEEELNIITAWLTSRQL